MESMTYQEWSRRRQERWSKPSRPGVRRGRGKVALGARERRRLAQLAVCVALFAVVLVGKGVFPQRLEQVRETLGAVLHADTDFAAVFAGVGRSIQDGEPVSETLGALWTQVFAPAAAEEPPAPGPVSGGALAGKLASGGAESALALLDGSWMAEEAPPETDPFQTTGNPPAQVDTAVLHVDYDGPALPANASMDRYDLGLGETVTPALGWVSSPFGWREHPVDGGEKFHNGVDLAVNTGTPIGAFAAGTVDYIGDSPVYGLYLQLDHGNGVTSFYAHCSKLCVQQGETVAMGETVAEAGETGNATGPHLHLEIKKDGVLLNPVYYIETQ
ncbi:MAG TPA: M23 family metallopeptidase [Candidatus Flavonifractor intestinipullorum]|uniref:M23 family metallopeptidase n=1 Tax=Candidatus Flavonifractor intestinipullorum TaxID=2838587 RepID=A0A9D2S4W2_9FIRM|nr:M23 family metallopeptidase [Candidatus Flavonifractor intestinipullorum]